VYFVGCISEVVGVSPTWTLPRSRGEDLRFLALAARSDLVLRLHIELALPRKATALILPGYSDLCYVDKIERG
jgi:hypothetical protein